MPLPNGLIDLRSDTVTHPTAAMWEAMRRAEIGDDVYGEDAAVNELEARAAEMLGKEAAVFVASGTMGNLASILVHCGRGAEMIVGDKSHIFRSEQGSASALGGVHSHQIANQPDGTLRLEDIQAAIRPDNDHYPRTRLICLENTQGTCDGAALTAGYTRAVGEVAQVHGLKLHIDGSRIFNAAVALDTPARELAEAADSLTFCLSKSLCCPVGSVIVGSGAFIREARRARKSLGGAMRQAGVLAAAGLVALETMVDRLAEDHANARRLAEGLAAIPGLDVRPERVRTNILFFGLQADAPWTAAQVAEQLKAYRVQVGVRPDGRFRAVAHYWVTPEDVEKVVEAFGEVLGSPANELTG